MFHFIIQRHLGSQRTCVNIEFDKGKGHIYLKYGVPDEILSQQSEPSVPPYEMWFTAARSTINSM